MGQKAHWKGKSVIITGSSRGIGRETARLLGSAGARIVLNGRNEARLQETADALRAEGVEVAYLAGDVSKREDMVALVAKAVASYGGVDLLINNAGISMRGPFSEVSEELARQLCEVNLVGSIVPTSAALDELTKSHGSLVFISSAAGLRGFPNVSVYSATKMALTGLAESLSAELHSAGVHVGVFYLGFTENDPDKEILNARGEPITVTRGWQHTQAQAAAAIAKAIRQRKRRAVFTGPGKILSLAGRLFPRLVDWAVLRAKVHGK